MIELLAALTLVANGAGLLLLATSRSRHPLRQLVTADALRLAWLVALVAMLGSLYMSEVRHFTPCALCWYQRIAMYSLVVVLGVAAYRGDDTAARASAVTLAGLGALVGVYHYQLERFPDQETIACTSSVPCTTIWFEQLGFITIPYMAVSAFVLIAVLLTTGRNRHDGQVRTDQG